jgi:hypothetical protein
MSRLVNTGYRQVLPAPGDPPKETFRKDGYLETLVKFIPAEAVALFVVLDNLVRGEAPEDDSAPEGRLVIAGFVIILVCLVLNILYLIAATVTAIRKLTETGAKKKRAEAKIWKDFWVTASITTIAYLVWVYTLPAWVISQMDWHWELAGAILLAVVTTTVPLVNTLRGVESADN